MCASIPFFPRAIYVTLLKLNRSPLRVKETSSSVQQYLIDVGKRSLPSYNTDYNIAATFHKKYTKFP